MSEAGNFVATYPKLRSSREAAMTAGEIRVPFAWPSPSRGLAWLREWMRRQRVMYELSLRNDRELQDIRMTRDEIRQIYTPEFARRHAEGG